MWDDIVLKEINLDFFEGIEDNSAFYFTFDENDKVAPVKETEYHLFDSSIYPFIIYHDELESLNKYCYETAQTIKKCINKIKENLKDYESTDYFNEKYCTKYEMLMSCAENMYLWERIVWQSSSHLTVLLYSFLERTLKKLWTDVFYQKEKAVYLGDKSNVKIYAYLEKIFCIGIKDFSQIYPELYRQLEVVRKYRNKVVHGQFKTNEINHEYEEIKEPPPFKLSEFIELISDVLDLAEWKYSISNGTNN